MRNVDNSHLSYLATYKLYVHFTVVLLNLQFIL